MLLANGGNVKGRVGRDDRNVRSDNNRAKKGAGVETERPEWIEKRIGQWSLVLLETILYFTVGATYVRRARATRAELRF